MELLTVNEVAKILKTSDKTIRQYISNGELPAAKLGKSWRIDQDDLHKFINDRKSKQQPLKEHLTQAEQHDPEQFKQQERAKHADQAVIEQPDLLPGKAPELYRQNDIDQPEDRPSYKKIPPLQCVKCSTTINYEGPCPGCGEPFKNILRCYYIDHDGAFRLKEKLDR